LGKQAIFVVLTLSLLAAQVVPSIAAAVSNFKRIRQVAALSRANRDVSWAFVLRFVGPLDRVRPVRDYVTCGLTA